MKSINCLISIKFSNYFSIRKHYKNSWNYERNFINKINSLVNLNYRRSLKFLLLKDLLSMEKFINSSKIYISFIEKLFYRQNHSINSLVKKAANFSTMPSHLLNIPRSSQEKESSFLIFFTFTNLNH